MAIAPAATRGLTARKVGLFAAAVAALMFIANVVWRESYTGDEGFYAVTAQNMLHAPKYWLRVSYFPMGDFAADHDGFAHPPFNSYLYAIGLWLTNGSVAGPELINLLSFVGLLYFSYRLLARFDELAAAFAVLLLAASPPIIGYFSMLEAEPPLTTAGIMGLYCAVRAGFERGERRWLFLAGLGLGFAFALKLWLCGPLALATAAALGWRMWISRVPLLRQVTGLALFALGFVLPAGLHLAAIAAFYPEDLGFWLNKIYFGIFTHAGISGSKFGGDAIPANWIHPVWYYGAAIYRDEFFLLPPVLFGAKTLLREPSRMRLVAGIALVGALGVVPLSLIKVKEPLYVLTCAVCLYLFAGCCLAAIVHRIASGRSLDRFSLWFGTAFALGLLVVFPAAYAAHVQPDKIAGTFVVAHTLVYAAFLGAVWWSCRRNAAIGLQRAILAGAAVAAAVFFTWLKVAERPRDITIARVVRPYLEAQAPDALVMFASNFKCYQYYTYRTGCYWHDLPPGESPEELLREPKYRDVRVFILDPDDQVATANAAWIPWLQANAEEKTADLDRALGRTSGYRIFVRDVAKPGLTARQVTSSK